MDYDVTVAFLFACVSRDLVYGQSSILTIIITVEKGASVVDGDGIRYCASNPYIYMPIAAQHCRIFRERC